MEPHHETTGALIGLHAAAPDKPALGEACNGCGVCCADEPCPTARLFLLQLRGPCRALAWSAEESRYRCGLITRPTHYLPWLPAALAPFFSRRTARRIAAGRGCDSDAEVCSTLN